MIHLFDVVPPKFFNLLSSQAGCRIYSDCLLVIFSQYDREITYKLPREQLRDAVSLYLMDANISSQDAAEILSDADVRSGESKTRQMASAVLRTFCSPDVSWMEEEADDTSYTRNIMITEQGLALCNFLQGLEKPERAEFSSFIYNIFNTLENREQWEDNPYVGALKNVYRNARDLSKALKTLSTFIRKIIESMVHEETFESLTENLLGYFEGDFIREYARLTKHQNIHTFRRQILRRLSEMESDDALMTEMQKGCGKEEGIPPEEAAELVRVRLDATRRFLSEDYDRIMADIKHKINVYLQVAVARARFLQMRGDRMKGAVEETMRVIRQELDTLGPEAEAPADMQNLFNWDPCQFVDLSSVSFPRQNQHLKKDTRQETAVLTAEDMERTLRQIRQEQYNPYAKKHALQFLNRHMQGKDRLRAEDVPLESRRDLLLLLSAAAYAGEGGYRLETEDGYFETADLVIRKFSFYRKTKAGHREEM